MKYIPFDKVVEIYNRISGHTPHNKTIKVAQDYALMVLNEVMDNSQDITVIDNGVKIVYETDPETGIVIGIDDIIEEED